MTSPEARPREPRTVTLGEAWAEAEAACPRHWRLSVVPYYPSGWEAEAHDLRYPDNGRGRHGSGTTRRYPTPTAALQALAAALRKTRYD